MKRSNRKLGAAIPLLLALAPQNAAFAADITISEALDDGSPIITISGEIVEGDQEKFLVLARKAPGALVSLKSPGGLIGPAMDIGRIIWFNDMTTYVHDAECASACGLIWLAGSTRAISTGGRVGFHSVYYSPSKNNTKESSSGNALVGAYLGSLKIGSKAIAYVTEASPRTMKWLSEPDAKAIDLRVLFLDKEYKAVDEYNAAVERVVKAGGQADPTAVELYTSAARLGFAGAQNNLGDLFENGNGVQPDSAAAAYWYTRSAERGEPTAYLSLSALLSKSGDPEILIEALKFAILATSKLPDGANKSAAVEILRSVSDRLPASSRVVAMEQAKKWVPLYQEDKLISDDPTP